MRGATLESWIYPASTTGRRTNPSVNVVVPGEAAIRMQNPFQRLAHRR